MVLTDKTNRHINNGARWMQRWNVQCLKKDQLPNWCEKHQSFQAIREATSIWQQTCIKQERI